MPAAEDLVICHFSLGIAHFYLTIKHISDAILTPLHGGFCTANVQLQLLFVHLQISDKWLFSVTLTPKYLIDFKGGLNGLVYMYECHNQHACGAADFN